MSVQDDPWLNPELSEEAVLAYASEQRIPETEVPEASRFAAFMAERVEPMEQAQRVERPPMPDTVRNAVALMFIGVALSFVQMAATIIQVSGAAARTSQGRIPLVVADGLLLSAMWCWMAVKNRQGRHWARVTSSVFFGLKCFGTVLSVVIGLHYASGFIVLDLAIEAVGLVVIVLLWHGRSEPYFRPPPAYPYGQVFASGVRRH